VNRTFRFLALAALVAAPALRAQWTAPTPEELSMTSMPEVPGAAAVYLFKEEIADDALHMQSFYVRLKVLTEGGKEFGNVELPYVSGETGASVDNIEGRTIHADGSIVPFTGKPYEKVVETMSGYKIKVKIFSLPAVEVGSIVEYRYRLHIDDHWFQHPEWEVQTQLYTRKAHYLWMPTERMLLSDDGKQVSTSVAWTPILPPGVTVKQSELMVSRGNDGGHSKIELEVHDIPPVPHEQYMPPMQSLSYKVLFYYTSFRSAPEFWNSAGKDWSKARDRFIGSGSNVKSAVNSLVAPGDTEEQKLRKIYSALMTFENTDFSRERSTSEERAAGLKEIKSADDVVTRRRGDGDQLAETFVAMARAAGMKAYVMGVADRSRRLFLPNYLSVGQLDDLIAIVRVDGKDTYFDPGQRYCSFAHLAWKHTLSGGLRQTDAKPELAATPGSPYQDERVKRIADLKLDDTGSATGTVTVEYTGDAALAWRQEALRGDETSLKTDLRSRLEHELPGGMEITVTKVENLTQHEMPLKVAYDVKGPIGSPTGKRLLVPANLFETNSKPKFPEPKRELPVDMHYPSFIQDAVRLTLPSSLIVESAPEAAKESMNGAAAFDTKSQTTANSITLYRNLVVGKTMFADTAYPELRGFYGKLEAKDQETVVLTRASAQGAGGTPGGY
jgi:hypothetical protein